MNNNKGFTLIELLAVIILLILIIVMAIVNLMPSYDKGEKKSFVNEAFVFSEGAINKYSDDRLQNYFVDDIFYGLNNNKSCYSINDLKGSYVNKADKNYSGSVELCNGPECTYKTKIWITNGEYYINGVIVDDDLTIDDISYSKGENFDSCGYQTALATTFSYTGQGEVFIAPISSYYKIEAWGASGGYSVCGGAKCGQPGNGGYAAGKIYLEKDEKIYVYVGAKGTDGVVGYDSRAAFNGGGLGTSDHRDDETAGGGGGASDVRLVFSYNWNDSASLASRILVAGGGGGDSAGFGGGSGGGLSGVPDKMNANQPGTQTSGYAFGYGRNASGSGGYSDGEAGGGGGYWGGTSYSQAYRSESGSGGSGYVSGHTGCVAIKAENNTAPKDGCANGTTDVSCSIHYSGKRFTDTVLLTGDDKVPTYRGVGTMTGNVGHGKVVITALND